MLAYLIPALILAPALWGQALEQGKRAFDAGNYAEAARLFEQANRAKPSCELQFYIGMARYRAGDADAAIIAFQSAVRCDAKLILAHLALAEAYSERGNENESLSAFQQALALDPRNDAALRGAASIYVRSKAPEKAIELLKRLVETEPRDPQAHADLGAAYFAAGYQETAAEQYREAIRLRPDSAGALLGLANIHLKKGEEDQAVAALRKVVRLAPGEFAPHYLLGSAYNRLGRFQEALDELQTAIRLGGNEPEVYYHLARAQGGLGDAAERRAALAKFAELTKKAKEDTEAQRKAMRLTEEAGALVDAGKLTEAAARMEAARELRPGDDRILFRLAGLQYDLKRDDTARSYLEEAISLAPSQWLYHYLLGLIETRSGNPEKARASLETARRLNPSAPEIGEALDAIKR